MRDVILKKAQDLIPFFEKEKHTFRISRKLLVLNTASQIQ